MKNNLKYSHLKISAAQLIEKILNSESWAFRYNAFIDGTIIGVPVGHVNGQTIYQQFERFRNQVRDLGLYAL